MKKWNREKPKAPGAYYVRGFNLGAAKQYEALVEVRRRGGGLICNLHETNSEPPNSKMASWSFLSDMSDRFEWCGPLVPANAIGQRGAACGASAAPTGCASKGTTEKEE